VRVDPAQQHWWWVFMRLRYAFMFATVFVVTAIYMLSIQSQLLLWVFYYSTKYAPRQSASHPSSFCSLSRCRWLQNRKTMGPAEAVEDAERPSGTDGARLGSR
jgi:hypothetical protein